MTLIAHDGDGNQVATLDYCAALKDGEVVGIIDHAAHAGPLTDIWFVETSTHPKVRSRVAEPHERPQRHRSSSPAHLPIHGQRK